MKRFFKFCGSLVLILVVVGLVFAGIGYFTAGPKAVTDMVYNLTDGRVNLDWSGVKVNLSGIGVDLNNMLDGKGNYDIDDQKMFDKNYTVWEKNVEKTQLSKADASSIEELNLELGGCEFVLEESSDDFFYFEYEGTGKTQAYIKDSGVYVKVLHTDVVIGDFNTNSKVTLYVPASVSLDSVKVSLGAGEMELDGLKAEQMEFSLGAGEIHAEGLQAEELEVSVGAGDIELSDAVLKDVDIQVGAGNFELAGKVYGNISAECAMGNITLKLAGSESDFNYDIECVTGNICIGDDEYSGLAQEKSIDNNASKNIDLECAMGNVDVVFE